MAEQLFAPQNLQIDTANLLLRRRQPTWWQFACWNTVMDQQTVLVVEDEFLIRMSGVDMLEEAGFLALEASSADEAIAVIERRPDICLVFTDIEMPGSMDGLRLVAAIRKRWPP